MIKIKEEKKNDTPTPTKKKWIIKQNEWYYNKDIIMKKTNDYKEWIIFKKMNN